jgi:hypothetical protein
MFVIIGVINAIANPEPATKTTNNTPNHTTTTPAEITMDEFNQIQNGLPLEQVEKIIGGKGELRSSVGDGQYKKDVYTWEGNSFGGNATVSFQGGRVMAKSQLGLE